MANKENQELKKLRAFFKAICKLTLDHDVLDDHAVVYPSKLGPELEKVKKEWWKS